VALLQIDNLVPGMVLQRDVNDRSGRLLLPKGATLETRHLSIFRMWGVLDVEVTGESEPEPVASSSQGAAADAELPTGGAEEVRRIFAHNDPEHPAIRELMRICIIRRGAHDA
jgi:hypothetical protein